MLSLEDARAANFTLAQLEINETSKGNLVVEVDIEERIVNRQAVVVVNSVPRLHWRGIRDVTLLE